MGFRWKCQRCGGELRTFKERALKSCDDCAREAKVGFKKMWDGKMEEGLDIVLGANNIEKKAIVKDQIKTALSRKEKKIVKMLKKKGLTDQQIEEGLNKYKQMSK